MTSPLLKKEGVGRLEGSPAPYRSFDIYLPIQRYRKVTVCARVQGSSGLNVVSEVPAVILFSTAHSTASV